MNGRCRFKKMTVFSLCRMAEAAAEETFYKNSLFKYKKIVPLLPEV